MLFSHRNTPGRRAEGCCALTEHEREGAACQKKRDKSGKIRGKGKNGEKETDTGLQPGCRCGRAAKNEQQKSGDSAKRLQLRGRRTQKNRDYNADAQKHRRRGAAASCLSQTGNGRKNPHQGSSENEMP